MVKKYCQAAGIDSDRFWQRGAGIHSLGRTSINDAIRHGARVHDAWEFAGLIGDN